MIKFQIYKGKDGLYHWRLKGANGEIVCWSEGYSSEINVINSVNWVKKNSLIAPIYALSR
jgi:uncharacterized protein YegP (UPF0339 family)